MKRLAAYNSRFYQQLNQLNGVLCGHQPSIISLKASVNNDQEESDPKMEQCASPVSNTSVLLFRL